MDPDAAHTHGSTDDYTEQKPATLAPDHNNKNSSFSIAPQQMLHTLSGEIVQAVKVHLTAALRIFMTKHRLADIRAGFSD